ncbi:MAG TPA: hypothetical protein VLV87_11565 [Gammaproteobacteria bacterium]|nr:hypothetical protein [Gammaproteobacteria bacterium]
MRITIRSITRALLATGIAVAGSAQAAHSYIPFTDTLNSGGNQGVWLADIDHLGNPPYQITNQVLDGSQGISATVAILDDWTLDPATHLATNLVPQLLVYGTHGHLYKVNLKTIQPVKQFTNAGYGELCSLTALDERPYAAAKAYVQAVVEPVGSTNTCASGIGMQTWLIPANANSSTTPIIEPTHWQVIGAFTDPTDGSFVRWVVWSGNELEAYRANFTGRTTLLVGPPTGPAPLVLARQDGNIMLTSSSDDGTTHTNTVYRVSMTGSGVVGAFSNPDTAPCMAIGGAGGSMLDPSNGTVTFAETTAAGYAVYATSIGGGSATLIYNDTSGTKCGGPGGDSVSGSYVGLDETDATTGETRVLGINEAGPATQAPNVLADSGVNGFVQIRYTVDGHFWIQADDFSGPTAVPSMIVADGDGTQLQDYAGGKFGDDIWGGFSVSYLPSIERDVVYVFFANATPCTGGTLTAVNPATFAGTNISGVPADACSALAYGWQPASVGYFQMSGGGSEPIEIDPVGGVAYSILGVDPNGLFNNLATLPGYPFY